MAASNTSIARPFRGAGFPRKTRSSLVTGQDGAGPLAARGKAGHHIAQQAPDVRHEWRWHFLATTGDRMHRQQRIMFDRAEDQGTAGDLVANGGERQHGAAEPVAHHLLDQRHAIGLLNPVKDDATLKRRGVNQCLIQRAAAPAGISLRPAANLANPAPRRTPSSQVVRIATDTSAKALSHHRLDVQLVQRRRILQHRDIDPAIQHPFLKRCAGAFPLRPGTRPATASGTPRATEGPAAERPPAALRATGFPWSAPVREDACSSGALSRPMMASIRSIRQAPAGVRVTPRPCRISNCVPSSCSRRCT